MRRFCVMAGACLALVGVAGCSNVLGFGDLAFEPDTAEDAGVEGGGGSGGSAESGPAGAAGYGGLPDGDAAAAGAGGAAGTGDSGGAAGSGGTSGSAGSSGSGGTAGSAGSAGSGGTAGAGGSGGGPTDPPALDLNTVTWLHTNVSGWPVTVNLASVTFNGGQICLNHDIASMGWPIQQISGTDVVANPWVFIYHDDRWYGATWEWLRPPGQTCKNTSSVAGDHIKVSPFDAASGWVPQSGETLYFMVSGLARGGLSNVQERSDVVKVVWP